MRFFEQLEKEEPAQDRETASTLVRETLAACEAQYGSMPHYEVMVIQSLAVGWQGLDSDPCYWDDLTARVHRVNVYHDGRITITNRKNNDAVVFDKAGLKRT